MLLALALYLLELDAIVSQYSTRPQIHFPACHLAGAWCFSINRIKCQILILFRSPGED